MLDSTRLLGRHAIRAGLWLLVPLCVTVTSATWSAPAFAAKEPIPVGATVSTADSCNKGFIDPNETVTVTFSIKNNGTTGISSDALQRELGAIIQRGSAHRVTAFERSERVSNAISITGSRGGNAKDQKGRER